jgi:hypothetical protein
MITAPPKQLPLAIRIPQDCPLLDAKMVICFLAKWGVVSGDDVMEMIELGDKGGLEYAFDLRRTGAEHAFPMVWRGSVAEFMARQDGTVILKRVNGVEEVIDDVLPAPSSFRVVQLKTLFGFCDRRHVLRLIEDGDLTADPLRPVGRGPSQSPWVTRSSAAEFLRKRRMPL